MILKNTNNTRYMLARFKDVYVICILRTDPPCIWHPSRGPRRRELLTALLLRLRQREQKGNEGVLTI